MTTVWVCTRQDENLTNEKVNGYANLGLKCKFWKVRPHPGNTLTVLHCNIMYSILVLPKYVFTRRTWEAYGGYGLEVVCHVPMEVSCGGSIKALNCQGSMLKSIKMYWKKYILFCSLWTSFYYVFTSCGKGPFWRNGCYRRWWKSQLRPSTEKDNKEVKEMNLTVFYFNVLFCFEGHSGLVLDFQSRGWGSNPPLGQKFRSRFLLH